MTKTTKVLSVINIVLTVFLVAIYLQYALVDSNAGDGSWADLGFFLIMFVFLITAIILTIPFLVIGIKRKFKEINLYLITHLIYVGSSVLLFIISLS